MLDSGVPLKTPVAGVAMGLILGESSSEEPVILTDILGLEDALGTMDFKIAGNETGITTFQLDIKSEGLTPETLQRALAQAKRGRLHILKHMRDALPGPRPLKDSIPKILSFMVPTEALGKVIGPKGATVTKLIETHKLVNINLEDSGLVQVSFASFPSSNPLPSLSPSSHSLFLTTTHPQQSTPSPSPSPSPSLSRAGGVILARDQRVGQGPHSQNR
jgi:polyribonucleotide nucleotidyltransferase